MKAKIIVLITLLITVLISQKLFAQEKRHHRNNCEQIEVCKKLNLTEDQQKKIKALKLSHQMEMVDLKSNLEKKELDLAKLMNSGNYTREEYIDLIESINSAKDDISVSKANFRMDIYQLLENNQKKDWNKSSEYCCERKEKHLMRKMKDINTDY